jgi:N-acetylneuraminic acid mutarotase
MASHAKFFIVTTMLLMATCSLALAAHGWKVNTSVPFPFGREGACIAGVGDQIFIIAGFGPSGDTSTNTVYTISSDSYTTGLAPIPSPPATRSEVAGVAHGGAVYCLGGRSALALSNNQRYDPHNDSWTTLAPLPIPVDAEYSAVVVGDQIHVIGGRTDFATAPFTNPKTDAHQVYDIPSNTWSSATPLPGGPRSDMCAVAHGNRIYVMGGNPPFSGSAVTTVDIYDVSAGSWSAGPPMPAPRANESCGVLGNSIYVLGGVDPIFTLHTDVFRFDIDKGTWSTSAPEPTADAETPGSVHGGRIFVITGGFEGLGAGPLGLVNQSFKPTPP